MNAGIDLQGTFIQSVKDLGIPAGVAKAIWMPLPMILMLIGATVGVLVATWLERKISAAAQQRIGPEYQGPFGLLVPVADGLKLIFKEDIVPAKADPWLFTLGPIIVVIPVFLSFLIVPFGENIVITNVGMGVFLWIALSSIQPIGLLMAGYASNNKYSLLGGLRAAAQSISYEIPLALSVLAIAMMSNSLSTIDIVNQQSNFGILGWNVWRQPLGSGRGISGRLSNRIRRDEIWFILCWFLCKLSFISPSICGVIPRRLGFPHSHRQPC